MASTVSIVNFALRRLGASPVSSLDDPTSEAGLAADTFDEIRESLLREHAWNFAKRRTTLAASAEAPAWGYTYAYPIPDDFLRLLDVDGASMDAVKVESSETDGRVFVTDLGAPLGIAYVANIDNADLMDPSFRRALSLRCAMEWAQKLTGTSTIVEQVAKEYADALREARLADGQEDTPEALQPNDWIDARI